jgi:hypothetical protein
VRSLSTVRPRPLWSTSVVERPSSSRRVAVTSFETGPPQSSGALPVATGNGAPLPAGRRRTLLIAGGVGLAVIALGVGVTLALGRSRGRAAAPASALGGIAVDSEPSGASVLIDGDPSGFVTPVVVRDLKIGRFVDIALDKPGYGRTNRRVEVLPGEPRRELFRLTVSTGTVRLEGVPATATVYVDEAPVEAKRPLSLPLGSHRIRVEGSEDVLFSVTIDVHAGEQTVQVRADGRGR